MLTRPSHLNSVDKTEDGHYLVSIRHADLILLVDGKDGHIHWRVGGVKNDFEMLNGVHWSRQHDARIVARNKDRTIISMMDNAISDKKFDEATSPNSRGLVVELHHGAKGRWTASLLRRYDRPDGGYAPKRGNLQRLPNNNVFMCWTDGGYISEHAESGEALMEAKWLRPDRFGTYRGFKFDGWVGKPKDRPVVKGIVTGNDDVVVTTMYVSWNGATEVKSWDFYSGKEHLGRAKRNGFETSFVAVGNYPMVRAEALDFNNTVIRVSLNIQTETPYPEGLPAPVQVNVTVPISHNTTAATTASWLKGDHEHILDAYPWLVPANIVVLTLLALLLVVRGVPRRWLIGSSWLSSFQSGYDRVPHYDVDKMDA
jgi:hypothetical protein